MLFDASGRRVRRTIGFLPEYRVVRDERKPEVDLISSDEIELDDDDELDDDELTIECKNAEIENSN